DDATGLWSSASLDHPPAASGAAALDGQFLFARADGVELLTPSAITEPANPSPAIGGGTAGAPAALSWDASLEASSYEVYLDGRLFETVASNHLLLDSPIASGSHVWQVIARNGAGATIGPQWTFTTPGAPAAHQSTTLTHEGAIVSVGDFTLSAGGLVLAAD